MIPAPCAGILRTRQEAPTIDTDPDRLVLFVCSGNTCRSPMAAAIARELADRTGVGDARIESAGTSAMEGAPATPEAREALRVLGIELGDHRSRPITPELIAEADEIICMTPAHLRAVLDLDPTARGKATTLGRRPVPDPIGMPPEVYLETARTLLDLIARRMQEAQL